MFVLLFVGMFSGYATASENKVTQASAYPAKMIESKVSKGDLLLSPYLKNNYMVLTNNDQEKALMLVEVERDLFLNKAIVIAKDFADEEDFVEIVQEMMLGMAE